MVQECGSIEGPCVSLLSRLGMAFGWAVKTAGKRRALCGSSSITPPPCTGLGAGGHRGSACFDQLQQGPA